MMRYLATAVLCLGVFTAPSEAGLFRHKSYRPKKVKAKYGVSRQSQKKRAEKARGRQMKNREKALGKRGGRMPKVHAKSSGAGD
ncbi:MAG: hypothetical protein LC126_04725 [Bryobacterales bacterium]|nr:hypothetical protein [Bryobacterales bacterium]